MAVLQKHEALAELIGKYGGARHLQPKNPNDVAFHRGLNSTLRAPGGCRPSPTGASARSKRAETALETASRRWAIFLKQDPELEANWVYADAGVLVNKLFEPVQIQLDTERALQTRARTTNPAVRRARCSLAGAAVEAARCS